MARKPTYEQLEQRIKEFEEESAKRIRMEEVLRENETIFRVAFEQAPVGMCLVNPDGRFLNVNGSICHMLGYSESELRSKTFRDITHPDDLDTSNEWVRNLLAGETTIADLEKRYLHKEGRVVWGTVRAFLLRNINGSPRFFVTHVQDITERKRAEDALKEREELFRAIFNNAGVGIAIADKNKTFTMVNDRMAQMLGTSKEELIGASNLDITHPDDIELSRERLESLFQRQVDSYRMEKRYLRKDGSDFWVDLSVSHIRDKDDNAEASIGMCTDITDRKRAEEALRESEKNYRDLYENAPVGYLELDSQGRIVRANRTVLETLGYTAEEMLGRHVWEFVVEKESQEIVMAKLAGILPPAKALERAYRRKDGTTVPVMIDDAMVRDENGRIVGNRSTLQDITERKRADAEKEKLQAQLNQAQKMESVGRLAGGVAHDFNNMLGVIIGNAELATLQVKPEEPLYHELDEILKASHRSSGLVRQLLAFARKQTVNPKVLDLNDTVSGMLKMLGRLIGEDIDLAWMPGHDLWPIKIDPSQIDQILANLAVNARDAIAGVGKLTIETNNVTFDEAYCADHPGFGPGHYVLLAVSDNGVGMSKDVLEHLFEPFFTTKEIGKGTGLGLSSVYGIAKQNNGFINVYSEPGKGTTFKIYLPRFEAESIELQWENKPETLRGGTETVLMVEDEAAILKIGKAMVERLGYRVLTASTPGEAVRLAGESAGAIHLVLTDVVMPEMNGRELVERLKTNHPGLKCLYMSGYTANVIAHHGVLDEGLSFIQKPFSMRDLAAKLREVLDKP